MKFIRVPLIVGMVLALAFAASAQKKKECALSQSPQFRGFHLGMTTLDVRSKLEDTTLFDLNAPKRGPGSQAVRLSAAELKEDIAEGIDEINLAFVDGRLALIKVTYRIECTGFAVALAYSFGVSPNFTINDMAAQRVADERLKEQGDVKTMVISPQTTRKP